MDLPGAFPAVASSLSTIRRAVTAYAQDAGAPQKVVICAVLAVNEAATNAIVHGYEGGSHDERVRVSGETDADWLRFTVADAGRGLHPRRYSPGIGLGFAIIGQLADEIELHDTEGGGVTIRMGFRRTG